MQTVETFDASSRVRGVHGEMGESDSIVSMMIAKLTFQRRIRVHC